MKINPRTDIETFYHVCLYCLYSIMIYLNLFVIVLDDHSRIILKCDKSIAGADYINANMIKVIIFTFL